MDKILPPRPRRIREVLRRFREVVRRFRRERRANLFRNLDRVGAIVLVKKSSKWELSSRFFGRLKFSGSNFSETLNGRLPLEDGSDRRETLPKRVSDDPQHFIFRRRKKFFVGFVRS